MCSIKLTNRKIIIFSPKNKKDLGMASHSTSQKRKETREMPLPSVSPVPSLNSTFFNWDETEAGKLHFALILYYFDGWSMTGYSYILLFLEKLYFLVLLLPL